MSFDWTQFLVLADELPSLRCRAGVEAVLRSSISRGYYGLFHMVRLELERQGFKFSGSADAHQELTQALRTSAQRGRVKLGIDLGRLRLYRNMADYQDQIENLPAMENQASLLRESIRRQLALIALPRNG